MDELVNLLRKDNFFPKKAKDQQFSNSERKKLMKMLL
jgi:hypothetical protein